MKNLFEVITTNSAGRAYGVIFDDQEKARAYGKTMKAAGYKVEPSRAFMPENDLAAALMDAADFYEDSALIEASKAAGWNL